MTTLALVRWVLLASSALAVLTGVAMHGLVRRLLVPYIMDASQSSRGVVSIPLKLFSLMIGRAWIFRVYHLCFAAVLLAGWWYFGTEAGEAAWARLVAHP